MGWTSRKTRQVRDTNKCVTDNAATFDFRPSGNRITGKKKKGDAINFIADQFIDPRGNQ